jgi:hypothetical protein
MSRACNIIPCPGKVIPMTTSTFAASFLQTLKYNVYKQYDVVCYLLKPIITYITSKYMVMSISHAPHL